MLDEMTIPNTYYVPWPPLPGGNEEWSLLILILPVDVGLLAQQYLDYFQVPLRRGHVQRGVVEPVAAFEQFFIALRMEDVCEI